MLSFCLYPWQVKIAVLGLTGSAYNVLQQGYNQLLPATFEL